MKNVTKIFVCSIVCTLLAISLAVAQSPAAFKYQAVVRGTNNAPLTGQSVSLRISILEGSPSGTSVYEESHNETTSAIGLVALNIGEGTVLSGIFDDINWASGDYYISIEIDENGGTAYQWLGTSQLLSVPFALFADKAASVDLVAGDGINIAGNEITNTNPSLWQGDSGVVFVDSNNHVAIGTGDTIPADTRLLVNGNIRVANDSSLLGVGKIIGSDQIILAANPNREEDIRIENNGRVTFAEEVGINRTLSFVDLNVRNQAGNSTVFQVEDESGRDLFEVGRTGNVGINQVTNNVTLQVQNRDTTGGVTNNIIANFERANGNNVLQIQDDGDVVITGDFFVNSGSKNFILDHPLDPANKTLAHNAVESPDYVTYYDGTVQLDANGEATVLLPEYFEALNTDFHYQLTYIGAFAQVFIAEEIKQNQFSIAGGKPGMKVSWQVSAKREDHWAHDHPYQAEEEKEPQDTGKYYYPEGYDKGPEFKIGANDNDETNEEDK
ncbi:MAG: hypothetical protein AB8F95_08390 [Bacteroidia bacterium]